MRNLAQDSQPDGGQSLDGLDSLPVGYRPTYDITTYVRDYKTYFDTNRVLMLPSAADSLVVPLGTSMRDNAAGAW